LTEKKEGVSERGREGEEKGKRRGREGEGDTFIGQLNI
jgi:hypothetical protein